MVSFDFASGQVMVGRTALPLRVVEDSGYLHINYPNGPILRALSVLERLRILHYVMSQNNESNHNSKNSLAAAVLQHATVQPGEGNTTLYQAIALQMAGAAIPAPPIHQSIRLIAKAMGWSPESIWSCEAAQLDQLAASFHAQNQLQQASGWNQLFFVNEPQDEAAVCVDTLAANLLRRMNDESFESGDENHSAQITHSADTSNEEQSSQLNKKGVKEEKNKTHASENEFFINRKSDNPSAGTQNKANAPPAGSDKNALTPEKNTKEKSTSPLVLKKLGSDEAFSTATVTHDSPNTLNNGMRTPYAAPQSKTANISDNQRPQDNEGLSNTIIEKQSGANIPDSEHVNNVLSNVLSNVLPLTSPIAAQNPDLLKASPIESLTPLTDVGGSFASQNSIKKNQTNKGFGGNSFVNNPFEGHTKKPPGVTYSQANLQANLQANRSAVLRMQETELNESVLDFFRDSQSSIADELANILNREADLRGI